MRTLVAMWSLLLWLAPKVVGQQLPTTQGRTPSPITAFVNINVIPMDRDRWLRGQSVIVRDGRITAIGPVGAVQVPRGATRVDGRGKFLMPGLADMHVHLGGLDSVELERALLLYLGHGVTTIRNLDYMPIGDPDGCSTCWPGGTAMPMEQLSYWRDGAEAGTVWSPRIYSSGVWRSDSLLSIEQNLLAYKDAGYDFVKVHNEDSATIDSVMQVAHRIGIPVLGHATAVGARAAMEMGYASIEHMTGWPGGIDSAAAVPSDTLRIPVLVDIARRTGTWNTPTLLLGGSGGFQGGPLDRYGIGHMKLCFFRRWGAVPSWLDARFTDSAGNRDTPPTADLPFRAQFIRRLVKALQDAGAGILLGNDERDCAPRGFGAQAELIELVHAGLTPYQALATGTRNVAVYFGIKESGTVAVGARADLMLLSANPLANIRNSARIAGVMANGRWFPMGTIQRRLCAMLRVGMELACERAP